MPTTADVIENDEGHRELVLHIPVGPGPTIDKTEHLRDVFEAIVRKCWTEIRNDQIRAALEHVLAEYPYFEKEADGST